MSVNINFRGGDKKSERVELTGLLALVSEIKLYKNRTGGLSSESIATQMSALESKRG